MGIANVNLLPSQQAAVAGVIAPDAHGVGTVTSGWVNMEDFEALLAAVMIGTLGVSATIDAKIEQAQDGAGTGTKDVTGKAITQVAVSDKQALINVRADELDSDNGFTHARLSLTVGVAASDAGAVALGFYPHYGPADLRDAASVDEIVE